MFKDIDWHAMYWAFAACLPIILTVVFLILHIADELQRRKEKKSLEARAKALAYGHKDYWDAPRKDYIYHIEEEIAAIKAKYSPKTL